METKKKSLQPKTALSHGLNYLSRYFKTEKEARKYLKDKGYLIDEINTAIFKLCEYGYINDDRYAEVFVQSNKGKYGAKLLKQKLRLKGINDEIILKYINNLGVEDIGESVKRLIEKFFKNKDKTIENKEKCLRNLMGKGFNYNDIKRELNYEDWN